MCHGQPLISKLVTVESEHWPASYVLIKTSFGYSDYSWCFTFGDLHFIGTTGPNIEPMIWLMKDSIDRAIYWSDDGPQIANDRIPISK